MTTMTADQTTTPTPPEDTSGETSYTSAQVALLAGCTYRQLHYWCSMFGIHHDRDPGSGNPRRWTRAEIRAACTLADLVRHGIQPRPWAESLIAVLRRHHDATYLLLSQRFDSPLPFTDAAGAARWVLGTDEPVTKVAVREVPEHPPIVPYDPRGYR